VLLKVVLVYLAPDDSVDERGREGGRLPPGRRPRRSTSSSVRRNRKRRATNALGASSTRWPPGVRASGSPPAPHPLPAPLPLVLQPLQPIGKLPEPACRLRQPLLPPQGYAGAVHVEGLAVNRDTGLVLEHAWPEHAGSILDPTLPDALLAYLPGLRFAGRDGLAEAAPHPGMLECGCRLPIFFPFGFGGYESPAFRAAREAAERYAGVRARGAPDSPLRPGRVGPGSGAVMGAGGEIPGMVANPRLRSGCRAGDGTDGAIPRRPRASGP
jgi:hypothetical protein